MYHTDENIIYRCLYLKFVARLPALDPRLALTLRVDEERIARCLGDDEAVLYGELVVWKSLEVPLADGRIVDQHTDDVQVLRMKHQRAPRTIVSALPTELCQRGNEKV